MDRVKRNFIYYLILLLAFYGLPLLIRGVGSANVILVWLIPVVCFVTSIIYGIRNGFQYEYPVVVGILLAPALYILFNSQAWEFPIAYAMVALLGYLLGILYRKIKSKEERDSQ